MNTVASLRKRPVTERHKVAPLRQAALCAFLVAAMPLCEIAVGADERSAEQIQSEVETLKAELAKQEQALAAKQQGSSAPATGTETIPQAAQDTTGTGSPATAAPNKSPAEDENRLDKVTVRVRNRLEPLKDVPMAMSVVTGAELDRLNAYDIESITKRAANVTYNQGNQRTSSLSIRGIGKQGQTEAQDPSVGVVVDGVNYAYNALTSSFDYTDVDTVEVSRGPQGTLLGKNTSLGLIEVNTKKPSFTPSADYGVTIGTQDTIQGRLAGGGPVINDLLAWRGTLTVDKGRGDIENRNNRDQTFQNKDRVFGKLQFLLTPTENLSVRVAADKAPRGGETTNSRSIFEPTPAFYSNGTPFGLDYTQRLSRRWFTQVSSFSVAQDYLNGGGSRTVNYDAAQPLVTGSNGGLVDVDWSEGNINVKSITAYKDYHFDAVNDDGTPFDVYRNAGGFFNDYKQWSQELRFSSAVGDIVDYQTGVFFLKVNNKATFRRDFGNDAGAFLSTTPQYTLLDGDAAGRGLLQNSLDNLKLAFNSPAGFQDINNHSKATFAQANWHLSPKWTLTTGARVTREDRQTKGASFIRDNGAAPELNPVSVNGVNLGGFASTTKGTVFSGQIGAGTAANIGFLNTTDPTQIALANATAMKYFGVATYNQLTGKQASQVAAAKAIRQTAIGVVFPLSEAEPFKKTQYSAVVSPSYKINDNLTSYVSWQYGEKAGISQFVNGNSFLVPGETSKSYEIGLKNTLLQRTLTLNLAAFYTTIKDYQQGVRVVDDYTTALNIANGVTPAIAYTTATGSVPKVAATGLELDSFYAGIPNTTWRLSTAYTHAYYKDFPNSAQPAENGFTGAPPFRDVSGRTLPGAFRFQANVGADFHYPVFYNLDLLTSANVAYTGAFNSDNTLSDYGVVPGKTIVDFSIGLGRPDRSLSATILVRNLFNNLTPLANTLSTTGLSYTPGTSRWIGLSVDGKL